MKQPPATRAPGYRIDTQAWWTFIRPFTLLVPASGMVAGAMMALGADPKWQSDWSQGLAGCVARVLAGAVLAASLNGYSNGVNQIYDIEVDRVNKPERMLPSGRMSVREAWIVSLAFLAVALPLAAWINWECLAIVSTATALTTIYSAPPLRTKSRGLWANITIAIPRGTLLVVCGWSTVKSVVTPEPWYIGAIFGAFFLGAATTKDFSDMEGDRLGDCRTLPVVYGVRKAAWIIAPFLSFPFLAILPGLQAGILSGSPKLLAALGLALPVWGIYIAWLLITASPEELAGRRGKENHASWTHMYLLTLVAQTGFATAYLIG